MRRLLGAFLALLVGFQPALAQTSYTPDSHSRGGDSVVRKGATVTGAFAQFQCPGAAPCSLVGPAPLTGAGGLVGVQTFTTAGTFTFTPDAGTSVVIVQIQCAGAGGGGVASPTGSNVAVAQSGSGGGYLQKLISVGFNGATIIVGAKGTGGAAGNNAGNNGGASSFATNGGPTYACGGGTGGNGGSGFASPIQADGQPGGAATGGDVNIPGGSSFVGLATSTSLTYSGDGGGSAMGVTGAKGAASFATAASVAGTNCTGRGSGGSGAVATTTGAAAKGGDGCDGQITVYEYGPSAIGGQAGLPVISEVVTSGSQSSVTFSNIPQTYRDLQVVIRGRGTASATNVTPNLIFNGDSGSDYDVQYLEGTSSAAAGNFFAQTNFGFSRLPGATAPSNNAGAIYATIFNYASTSFYKDISVTGGAIYGTSGSTTLTGTYTGDWRSTSGVTSITVGLSSGAFQDGSVVTLYGIGGSPTATLPLTTPQGRLTLTSGSPVMTADATAQGTIYYDNYVGNLLPVGGIMYRVGELSDVLNSSAQLSGSLYDVFAYNSSGTIALCTGPAWSSATARSAAVSLTNGIWSNTASLTCTISGGSSTTTIAAAQATLLGTMYATANGQTGIQYRPSPASGGNNTIVGLSNAYNRVGLNTWDFESACTFTTSSTTFSTFNASTSNRVTMVDSLAQSPVETKMWTFVEMDAGGHQGAIGVNKNATTGAPLMVALCTTTTFCTLQAIDHFNPSLGLNYFQLMEGLNSGTGTATYCDGGATVSFDAANDNAGWRAAA